MVLKLLCFVLSLWFVSTAQAAAISKPLTGRDLETAQAMNDIYARHMMTSSCIERQKVYFIPFGVTEQERKLRIESFAKSCECMTGAVLKTFTANDVIDYVTNTYGSVKPPVAGAKVKRPQPNQQQAEKFSKMNQMMNIDKETRNKCGFQK